MYAAMHMLGKSVSSPKTKLLTIYKQANSVHYSRTIASNLEPKEGNSF